MTQDAILLPMCVLAIWTILVLGLVPIRRVAASRAGRTHVKDYRYGESANVPGDVSLPNRNYMNLLELPVLFYAACLALVATKRVDQLYLWLAWAFVAARLVHSLAESRTQCVDRIPEIGPARRQVGAARGTEGAAFGFPARGRRLRRHDLVGGHALEEIIARVEFADMIEAQPAILRRAVG